MIADEVAPGSTLTVDCVAGELVVHCDGPSPCLHTATPRAKISARGVVFFYPSAWPWVRA